MIGIIPAAGAGERIQPLGCSKELLPVGSRMVAGVERPKAVSEYLVERMIAAGASQICMVISAEKTDIVKYYAERDYAAEIFYVSSSSHWDCVTRSFALSRLPASMTRS